jgi:hypothetical protein
MSEMGLRSHGEHGAERRDVGLGDENNRIVC